MFMGLAITQLLICADFMIYWVKAILVGDDVVLPQVKAAVLPARGCIDEKAPTSRVV